MEQGLLHVTEPGPPEQSVPSHDPEAAGQPAELEIATTQNTLSEPLLPTWAPRLSPGPELQGSYLPSREPRALHRLTRNRHVLDLTPGSSSPSTAPRLIPSREPPTS